jgi:hypothetical protein
MGEVLPVQCPNGSFVLHPGRQTNNFQQSREAQQETLYPKTPLIASNLLPVPWLCGDAPLMPRFCQQEV